MTHCARRRGCPHTAGASAALFACFLVHGLAHGAAPGADAASADLAQSEDYVATPAGLYHRSCVHAVESGSVVDSKGNVTLPNGAGFTAAPCEYPSLPLSRRGGATEPTLNGWIENSYAYAPGGSWIKQLTADWTVPARPDLFYGGNQVFYTFPGLQRFSPQAIIQPVLQYGLSRAGGGNYWAIASWYCGPICFYSNLVQVNQGDSLHGTIAASCDPDLNCLWTIQANSSSGASTTLALGDRGPDYIWATGGALEVYNLDSCGNFPSNGPTVYSNVSLYDPDGNRINPSWGLQWSSGQTPYCNFSVSASFDSTTLNYSGGCGSCPGSACGNFDGCGRCCGGDCGAMQYCEGSTCSCQDLLP
jgi:hypothetical protein